MPDEPKTAGKLDWIGLASLIGTIIVVPTVTTVLTAGLYLNNALHQIQIRLTRIETRLGIDDPGISVTQR